MKKLRTGLIVFAIIAIIGQFLVMDYSNLSWSNNAGNYLGIFSMIGIIISIFVSKSDEA